MGLDILRIANGIMPNLILLDVNMPPIEGQNCLEKLRSTKMYSIIKIVMVGDRSEKANLEKSVKKGAEGYITRPISATELYRTVHNLVELHPRQIPRLRVIFKTTIFVGNTGRSSFATRISEQGAFIHSLNPLPVNTKIKLALDLPSEKPLTLDGEVIYVVKPGQEKYIEPGMGIRFLNLDREIQLGLRKFIEDQLTGEFDSEMLI
ncbi:MAG: response regulator [Deltaproteobacteria bacterium]|nr:response regulator [Deltaproteobacteria bacterium]